MIQQNKIREMEAANSKVDASRAERHSGLFASKSAVETIQEDEDKKIDDDERRKWISFGCRTCNLDFATDKDFIEHRRVSHPSRWPQRSQTTVLRFVDTTRQQEDEDKKYQANWKPSWTACQFCGHNFPSPEHVNRHISSDHHPSLLAIVSGQKDVKDIIGVVDMDVDIDEDDDEKEIWLTNEHAIAVLPIYAQAALEHYNNQNVGKRYVLVKHGPNASAGTMDHINFKAKDEDCPGAPVETFFAQLTHNPGMRVDCCVSLGPSRNLPHWRTEAQLGGCRFCRPMIKHPREMVANLILDPFSRTSNF